MSDEDNRKRVHQQDDNDFTASSNKRVAAIGQGNGQEANYEEDGSEPMFFKLLCPQGITGLIIGKGGTNIIQLNTTTGARIKLSQNNEYFPNTNDRILLISGGKDGIENAIRELVSRIVEAPEKRLTPGEFGKPQPAVRPNGSYTIRVLIPKVASAAVIGKGGSVIKRMSEQSGCRYQLGEENDPFNTNERIVTITGTTSQSVVAGTSAIMNQLLDEPRVRTYINSSTNYSGRSGPPHSSQPQNLPHMMGSPPAAGMMHAPNFAPYGGVPAPYMAMQYPGMGQMQVPMQQAMYAQGMQAPAGYSMQAPQYPMGVPGAAPAGYVPAHAPMYAGQYPAAQPGAPMDMNQAYQQQQQQQIQHQQQPQQHQYGAKTMYAPQTGMPMPQQMPQQHHQHQQAPLGTNHYNGGNAQNGGKMK